MIGTVFDWRCTKWIQVSQKQDINGKIPALLWGNLPRRWLQISLNSTGHIISIFLYLSYCLQRSVVRSLHWLWVLRNSMCFDSVVSFQISVLHFPLPYRNRRKLEGALGDLCDNHFAGNRIGNVERTIFIDILFS